MKTRYGVLVIAYKTNPAKLLLIKNRKTGTISPIAGAIKEGEDIKETAVREIKEEVGWYVQKTQLKRTLFKHIFTYGPQKEERASDKGVNYVLLLDATKLPEPKTTAEASKLMWLSPDKAIRKISFPDLREIVQEAIGTVWLEQKSKVRKIAPFLKGGITSLFLLSILTLAYSYLEKDTLPPTSEILSSLYQEPTQSELEMEPFSIEKEESTYQIIPRYNYELYGLVVAEYDSENFLDLSHEKDPLNTKDLCIIWGENVMSDVYHQMKFRHGEWTCFFEFKSGVDSEWFSKFNDFQGANNHLLPKNEDMYKAIKESRVGDQIHLQGYLVDYSIQTAEGQAGSRTTSTSREDTGCEVIYVTEFEVLKRGETLYDNLYFISKYSAIILLLLLILFVFLL